MRPGQKGEETAKEGRCRGEACDSAKATRLTGDEDKMIELCRAATKARRNSLALRRLATAVRIPPSFLPPHRRYDAQAGTRNGPLACTGVAWCGGNDSIVMGAS